MTVQRRTFIMSAAAAAIARPRSARAQGLTPVRIGTAATDDTTPLIYGQKSGIFAKYGIDLQLNKMYGPATAGLIGGSYDVGKSILTSFFDAHEKGFPLSVIVGASFHNPKVPYAGFLVRKETPPLTGEFFNNKVVAVSALGGTGYIALRKWIADHGGDIKSIKYVEIPTAAGPAAVEQGRVVIAETVYPAMGAGLATGKVRIAPMYDSIGTGYIITALAITKDFSAKRPEVVRNFVHAWRESATYTNAHHAETVAMMSEFTGIPAAIIAQNPRVSAGVRILPSQIQPVIEADVKFGDLPRAFPAAELIDPNANA